MPKKIIWLKSWICWFPGFDLGQQNHSLSDVSPSSNSQQLQLKPHPSFGKIAPSGLKSKKKFNSPTCRCPWAGRLSVGCCDKESLSDMLRFPELYRCDSLRGLHGHFWHLQRKTATQFGITYYNSFSQVNHTPHLRQNHGFLLEIKNRKNAVWIKTINFFS